MADPASNWNELQAGPTPVPPTSPAMTPIPSAPVPLAGSSTNRGSRSRWVRAGIIAGLAVMALLLIGAVTGNIRFFVAGGGSVQPKPADAFPQLGTAENGVLRGERVSFRYPKHWQVRHEAGIKAAGSSTGVTILGLEAGDEVAVETMPLILPVRNSRDFDEFATEIRQLMQQHERTTNERIVGGPIDATLGGLPAVEYRLQGPGPAGLVANQRIVVSARGMTEYWITCFSTDRHAAAIQKGCDQILRTFKIS